MTDPWRAEHPVDHDLAASLVAEQLPHLAGALLERVGEGWDNDVWRVADLALRFPRRRMGVELIEVEARVLPALAPRLPVAVPAAVFVGEPSAAFPYTWVAHPWLAGTTLDRAALVGSRREALAPALGGFLRALHSVPVDQARASGVPDDGFRADLERMRAASLPRLARLEGTDFAQFVPGLRDALSGQVAGPGPRRVTCHGDLYSRHLLLDDSGALVAVIDWGDVCIADPAVDLMSPWIVLPPAGRRAFLDAYGPIDPVTWRRGWFRAVGHQLALLVYALDVGERALATEAGGSFERLLAVPSGPEVG